MFILQSLFYPYDPTIESNPFIYYDDDEYNYEGYTRYNNMIYISSEEYDNIDDCIEDIKTKAKIFEEKYNILLYGRGNHKYIPITSIITDNPLLSITLEDAVNIYSQIPYSYKIKDKFRYGEPIIYREPIIHRDKPAYKYVYYNSAKIHDNEYPYPFIPLKTYYLNPISNIKLAYCYYHPYNGIYTKHIEYNSNIDSNNNPIKDFHVSCIYKCMQ